MIKNDQLNKSYLSVVHDSEFNCEMKTLVRSYEPTSDEEEAARNDRFYNYATQFMASCVEECFKFIDNYDSVDIIVNIKNVDGDVRFSLKTKSIKDYIHSLSNQFDQIMSISHQATQPVTVELELRGRK